MRLALGYVALVAAALVVLLPGRAAAAPFEPNPCLDLVQAETLLCPDMTMSTPFSINLDVRSYKGHKLLRSANSINSVGDGPVELRGFRSGVRTMKARQRIYRTDGFVREVETGARLVFHYVPNFGGNYWKFRDAAQFELWRLDSAGVRTKRVRIGEKAIYCLRDLARTRGYLSGAPTTQVYPACNKDRRKQAVTLGTSVGWSDIYPARYYEQYVDITGLAAGCYAYVQIADPDNRIYELNETNNSSQAIVRLPYKGGARGCKAAPLPGKAEPPPTAPPPTAYP